MKVEYKKDLHHSFMVISEIEAASEEAYCIKLQKYIRLEGLLLMERRIIDNQVYHYYDITGKQSLISLFEKGYLTYDKVKQLILNLILTIEKSYEYLLNEEDFILAPEYVFMDVAATAPYLCYLSGFRRPLQEQVSCFIEYIMNKVDYNDKEAVLLVYGMYSISKEEHFTIDLLYDILQNKKSILDSDLKPKQEKSIIQDTVANNRSPGIEDSGQITNKNDFKQLKQEGSFMMEKLVDEEEVACYTIKTYLTTGACGIGTVLILVVGFASKLMYNSFGNRLDYSKLFGLLLLIVIGNGILLHRIWDKKNRITKVITKKEYIDPQIEDEKLSGRSYHEELREKKKTCSEAMTVIREENASDRASSCDLENPTCILNDFGGAPSLILKPLESNKEGAITVTKFPFFVGKVKENVDLLLDYDVISRYHAKLTTENSHYYLTDLNSTNGTCHNGIALQPYEKIELQSGDEVAFANIKFQYQTL